MSPLTLILACTKSNGIGLQGQLPWRLPKEMKYFAAATTRAAEGKQNAVIMGRNTWESIPAKFRPLKGRLNVVISRNPEYALGTDDASVLLRNSLKSALEGLDSLSTHRAFVIGGAQLYKETLSLPLSSTPTEPFVDRILLTRIIEPDFECDVFMDDFLGQDHAATRKWTRAPHDALKMWLGFDVDDGIQKEGEVKYEYQMWVR
ncbi:dihydrofolate reductase-like domain-containing protein [Crepidotus variabilis]|uniref:Dihydrofolate reductase n=1 Tax=Crepidotus variabilis TaxID=179855 RepID=A0A9P6EU18_9AGAR|nr:dihydrofolate reductase-like domain-containing protein [Crepidotus variabilis]